MSKSKRHHFVPQMLQKRFVDADGLLHVYRKESGEIFSSDPKNVFLKGHLHTSVDREGQTDDELERFFAELEGVVDPFIEKVVESARAGRAPDVNAVEKENWDGFSYYQVKRVPDFHDQIVTEPYVEKRLQEIRGELLAQMPHRTNEIERAISEAKVPDVLQNARVKALSHISENVMQVLSNRGLTVLHIDPGMRKSFIVGSAPVARLEPGGLRNLNGEWWLPVATDVAIGLTPNKEQVAYVPTSDSRLIRHLNVAISGQSDVTPVFHPAGTRVLS